MKFEILKFVGVMGAALALNACSNITKEDSGQLAGTVAGGALGYALGDDDNKGLYAAGGALAGGLGTSYLLGNKDEKKGFDLGKAEGYAEGQADSAKRMYWVLQAAQGADRAQGSVSLREVELAPTYTEDGRFLMARKITMPIVDAAN